MHVMKATFTHEGQHRHKKKLCHCRQSHLGKKCVLLVRFQTSLICSVEICGAYLSP